MADEDLLKQYEKEEGKLKVVECSDYIIGTRDLMIYYQCDMIIHKRDYSELHLRVNTCTCLPSSYPITTLATRMESKKKKQRKTQKENGRSR